MSQLIVILVGAIVLVFGVVVFRGAPYVPSRRRDIEKAFTELYQVGANDLLVDIGSGDGVVLRAAARRGARAVGYELNPILVAVTRILGRSYGPLLSVRLADFWLVKLPEETTVVYTFGESRDIGKMYQKVQREATRLGRPLYFMSYGFAVPGQTELRSVEPCHLYLVEPLQVVEP